MLYLSQTIAIISSQKHSSMLH